MEKTTPDAAISAFIRKVRPSEHSIGHAQAVTAAVTAAYWEAHVTRTARALSHAASETRLPLRPAFDGIEEARLPAATAAGAAEVGAGLAAGDPLNAGFQIGRLYASLLPRTFRGRLGIYYTPVVLSNRLLDMAGEAGTRWATARVVDPACGGGAFLAPVARRKRQALAGNPEEIVERVAATVFGYDIDPFGAWLSQVMLEAEMLAVCLQAGRPFPRCVEVRDTLAAPFEKPAFDLVVGNPPYGRVSLAPPLRARYSRSLYGHANLYGLFTDQALRMARPEGVIAFITPASFLSGQYFKNLRLLLAKEAPPHSIDLVVARAGVFEDVLQETVLATYRKGATGREGLVHEVAVSPEEEARITPAGRFRLFGEGAAPWVLPRSAAFEPLVARLQQMPHRLADYGYTVSTGPLVWNRHKDQLRTERGPDCYPLVWAEAITADGQFAFRAEKRNHAPYFAAREGDEWLLVRQPCVLLQRTTAKEQKRRLIAAFMPPSFLEAHGAAVVENHLNMILTNGAISLQGSDLPPEVLTALLNSPVVDQAFRCMNGSVAVSAYELASLPLPDPTVMHRISKLLKSNACKEEVDTCIAECYLGPEHATHPHLGRSREAA